MLRVGKDKRPREARRAKSRPKSCHRSYKSPSVAVGSTGRQHANGNMTRALVRGP